MLCLQIVGGLFGMQEMHYGLVMPVIVATYLQGELLSGLQSRGLTWGHRESPYSLHQLSTPTTL